MSNSSEKIVKYLLKTISKVHQIDYSILKNTSKKVIKLARNNDEQLLGLVEELMDLVNVSSESELVEFDIETLKMFCRVKEIEYEDVSDKGIRKNVWMYLEEEMGDDDDESDDDDISEESDDSGDEVVPEPPPPTPKSVKIPKEQKPKKTVVINESE